MPLRAASYLLAEDLPQLGTGRAWLLTGYAKRRACLYWSEFCESGWFGADAFVGGRRHHVTADFLGAFW